MLLFLEFPPMNVSKFFLILWGLAYFILDTCSEVDMGRDRSGVSVAYVCFFCYFACLKLLCFLLFLLFLFVCFIIPEENLVILLLKVNVLTIYMSTYTSWKNKQDLMCFPPERSHNVKRLINKSKTNTVRYLAAVESLNL